MNVAEGLSDLLKGVERARANIKGAQHRQVRGSEDRAALKSLAFAWFNSYRPTMLGVVGEDGVKDVDPCFRTILDATEKNSAKSTYLDAFARSKDALISLRGRLVMTAQVVNADDAVPDFSPLVSDVKMKLILDRRWNECRRCVDAEAHLAGIVMMGGLLEALFVARANKLHDKSPLFKTGVTPIDFKTKKALELKEWTLKHYLDVGHELAWITRSGKDVAAVLRDYRNYVHPEKERSHGVILGSEDSSILWQVTKGLCRQLLASAATVVGA
jgi:hypothetical protein